MSGLCETVTLSAKGFMGLAFLVAAAEMAIALIVSLRAAKAGKKAPNTLGAGVEGTLDALAKILAALKDLPAWVAIFLAALALVWTAASAPGLCP